MGSSSDDYFLEWIKWEITWVMLKVSNNMFQGQYGLMSRGELKEQEVQMDMWEILGSLEFVFLEEVRLVG